MLANYQSRASLTSITYENKEKHISLNHILAEKEGAAAAV